MTTITSMCSNLRSKELQIVRRIITHGIMTRTTSMMLMLTTILLMTIIHGILIQISTIHILMIHTSLKLRGTNMLGTHMARFQLRTHIPGSPTNSTQRAPGSELPPDTSHFDGNKGYSAPTRQLPSIDKESMKCRKHFIDLYSVHYYASLI